MATWHRIDDPEIKAALSGIEIVAAKRSGDPERIARLDRGAAYLEATEGREAYRLVVDGHVVLEMPNFQVANAVVKVRKLRDQRQRRIQRN